MNDMISRQAAIDALNALEKDGHAYVNGAFFETILRDEVKRVLEELPSAQSEIILCKDCNSADFAGCSGAVCYCMEHGTYMYQWDYCGRAEMVSNGQAD